ncbi:Fic family protein [Frigoribacterium sp. CFBP 13605]|uniref:Fic family protein n=1 Tax=Frigoribacterium sp. CFBP 13605 TaxID=2774034 RepID=UPI001903679E|nr:Fic family protein [Frigoribacterium sp. CFBP 13605]MBD8139879.1 Fic family protein [Frigoribacterium sp. CFBP 13605]
MTTKRKYEETHPWLTFLLDLGPLGRRTWLLLGEAESKCSHLAGAPLTPAVAQEMHAIYLSKGIHGTTSIEGNTLTEAEVRQRIDGDLDLPRSREYLGTEIDAVLDICNELAEEVRDNRAPGLSVERIHDFNRRLLEGQPAKEDVVPGQTRTHSVTVGISSYRGAPAEDCDYLLERMVVWLNELQAPADSPELRFPLAVLKAVLAHLYIAWIHPFGDGNGRTARLIEFQLMIEAGAPTPAAHLLSNHYNRTREAYLVELDKTSRARGYPIEGFILYALQGLVDELRDQIKVVHEHQKDVMWQKIVHDSYRDEDTPAKRRQRHLILDMPNGQTVPRAKLKEVSARVAGEYAGSGTKTLTRDLNELVDRKLIVRRREGYVANRKVVDAFLPLTMSEPDS